MTIPVRTVALFREPQLPAGVHLTVAVESETVGDGSHVVPESILVRDPRNNTLQVLRDPHLDTSPRPATTKGIPYFHHGMEIHAAHFKSYHTTRSIRGGRETSSFHTQHCGEIA